MSNSEYRKGARRPFRYSLFDILNSRALRRLLVIIVGTYACVCVLVYLFQTRLIYFPSAEYQATPTDVGLDFEDITLQTTDGVAIAAWYVPHPEPKGTILFCHGNAGNISHRLVGIKDMHRFGYSVLIFDYRGYGRSGGSPGEAGTYLDAQAAWEYLTQTVGEPPGRIALYGRSLGGAVAIELARSLGEGGPAALVVESTFARLADVGQRHYRFLPIRWLTAHRYDSIDKVGEITCPKLFLHGTDDQLIPIGDGRRLYEAAAPPKLFIETPGGHNTGGFTHAPQYSARLAEFLDEAMANSVR